MTSTLRRSLLAAAFLLGAGAVAGHAAEFHFDLARSVPEAGATVSDLSEIRMWFTQVPQQGSLTARVVDAQGDLVDAPGVAQDTADGKIFHVPLADGLPEGAYTVRWRGIGQDGHVVRGDFGFRVTSGTCPQNC